MQRRSSPSWFSRRAGRNRRQWGWIPTLISCCSCFHRSTSSSSSGAASAAALADPSSLLRQVLPQKAALFRQQLPEGYPSNEDFYHPSSYLRRGSNGKRRGFCNWLLPNFVMVGQYPGMNPEKDGPTTQDVQSHIQRMVTDEGISLFCSLQSELPPQDDYDEWKKTYGKIYLAGGSDVRSRFPNPFTHYAPLALQYNPRCRFIHNPIADLSVPNESKSLHELLDQLLDALLSDDEKLYIHCWGGRGRAGIVGSCLVSLIYPELTGEEVLDWIQSAYSSRDGHVDMAMGLKRSPQTSAQRTLVKDFVKSHQHKQ